MFEFFKKFFGRQKLRVRKLDMETGYYIGGTVEGESHEHRLYAPEVLTYWTIVWDDAPGIWITVPSFSFLWHDGSWTLIEK